MTGYSRGHVVLVDERLRTVKEIQSQAGLMPADQHELNVVEGGRSVIMTVFQAIRYDLSPFGLSEGEGWVLDCLFQEIDVETDELLYQWSALDHVPLTLSSILPNSTDISGDGLGPKKNRPGSPWDYFHMNSVDKNHQGDYLVSSRHCSAVFKVSGRTGSIVWQLGGPASDFTFESGLNFTFQHHARFLQENATITVISLLDNASNDFNQSSSHSSGLILRLDHITWTVSLLQRFLPSPTSISDSQGSMQVLEKADWQNSNVFIGWGSQPRVSEYLANGTIVQDAFFAAADTSLSYRAFKLDFKTDPDDSPVVYAYAHNTSAQTVLYVSWNGATEVAYWRIIVSNTSEFHESTIIDVVLKRGFETICTIQTFYPYVVAEALDSRKQPLKSSSVVATFVPGAKLAESCGDLGCPEATAYDVAHRSSDGLHSGATRLRRPVGRLGCGMQDERAGVWSRLKSWCLDLLFPSHCER